jgi:transcriptional regulator with XRE-family HTH domain
VAAQHVDQTAAAAQFGGLVRQHRLAQGLTQENLAERAGLSAHGIQKLERGRHLPYRDTAERLCRALDLTGEDEARFKAAAQPAPLRRIRGASVKPLASGQTRHNLPFQTTSFVGRYEELAKFQQRLRESRLLTITGSGGSAHSR